MVRLPVISWSAAAGFLKVEQGKFFGDFGLECGRGARQRLAGAFEQHRVPDVGDLRPIAQFFARPEGFADGVDQTIESIARGRRDRNRLDRIKRFER